MKRLFILFIVLLLPSAAVFSQKKETYRVRTVVIDPGHGGAKPGAQGSHSQEKNITLSIAKKFGRLIEDNYPDVKVIYTRTTDVDISLSERARIANRNKADLFISIHANSHPTSVPNGVETFVMGLSESKANLEVAKKENADILLEADYKKNSDYSGFDPNSPESYVMLAMFQNAYLDKSLNLAQAIQTQYMRNFKAINRGVKQAELFVLYKTTCPSVLTEVGFISNHAEEAFMLSDEGQAKIAISLFNAFMTYKATEEGTNKITNPKINLPGYKSAETKSEAKPEQPAVVSEEPEVVQTVAEERQPVAEEPQPVAKPKEEPRTVPPVTEKPTVDVAPQPEAKAVPPSKPTPTVELPQQQAPVATEPEAKSEPVKAEPETEADPVVAPAPEAKPKPQKQKPAAADAAAPAKQSAAPVKGLVYRVQLCSSSRLFKAGDPELQGVKDIHSAQDGRYYIYTAGNYATQQEAAKRCNELRKNTSFKDAFVIAIYNGERISLSQAAALQKKK